MCFVFGVSIALAQIGMFAWEVKLGNLFWNLYFFGGSQFLVHHTGKLSYALLEIKMCIPRIELNSKLKTRTVLFARILFASTITGWNRKVRSFFLLSVFQILNLFWMIWKFYFKTVQFLLHPTFWRSMERFSRSGKSNILQSSQQPSKKVSTLEGKFQFFRLKVKFFFLKNYHYFLTELFPQILIGVNRSPVDYLEIAKDPLQRKQFIKDAHDFLERYKFDGLHLIWDYSKTRLVKIQRY